MYHSEAGTPVSGISLTKGIKYSSIWYVPNAVGVFNGEGPPVPIPNTEVKLTSAENTCLETDRENRSMPTQRVWRIVKPFAFASLAQQVEHAAVNRRVVGSNPTGGANKTVLPSRYRDGNRFSGIWTVSSVGRATGS